MLGFGALGQFALGQYITKVPAPPKPGTPGQIIWDNVPIKQDDRPYYGYG